MAVEFAHELARRLAVPLEIIPYKSAGALADSVSSGAWEIWIEKSGVKGLSVAPAAEK